MIGPPRPDRGRPARNSGDRSSTPVGARVVISPHWDAPELIQHVLFRLVDSLPARVKEEIAKVPPADRIQTVDASLDQGYGRRDLKIPEIARLVQDALLAFDGERYGPIAWCVMPNHVHTLIE